MQSFYTQMFMQSQSQDTQMLALAKITHLSNDKLRSLAGNLTWSIWN